MTIYVSSEDHSSFGKAVDMLGNGKKQLRKIPVGDDFRINLEKLDEKIRQDRDNGLHPIWAIGIAGTTNTGAIDDLNGVADICRKHNLWFHVDAAYGGPAASLDEHKSAFNGMDHADGIQSTPDQRFQEDFARPLFSPISACSRKVWMTMKAYGADKLRQMIRADIEKARYRPLEADQRDLNKLNNRLINRLEADGRHFLTGTEINGKTVLRVCLINPRTKKEHMDRLIRIVKELGSELK